MRDREIKQAISGLIQTRETNLGLEIALPILYPDGATVSVVIVKEQEDRENYVVHDASSGTLYLTQHGVRLNPKLRSRLAELVRRYGCEFAGSRVERRCTADQVAMAAVVVANASRTVGDQTLELRKSADRDFKQSVIEGLRKIAGSRVRENQDVKGNSGRWYRLPALILDRSEREPVAFVSTIANRSAVGGQFAELYDLKEAFGDVRREAVYDENSDLREEDRNLLAQAGEVVPSRQVGLRFERVLAA